MSDNHLSGRDRYVGRSGADLLNSLLLGTRDFFFRKLYTALQRLIESFSRFFRVKMRFPACHRNYIFGLFFGVSPLALVIGQDRLGFFTKATCLLKFSPDPVCPIIQCFSDSIRYFIVHEKRHKQNEGYENPKFGGGKHITPSSLSKRFFHSAL